jgi:Predicted pPIWI-associating nuclease
MGNTAPDGHWDALWATFNGFRSQLRASSAVNVNSEELRTAAKGVIQLYFRQVRPELVALGVTTPQAENLDAGMQELLRLSNGRNPKDSYLRVLRRIHNLRPEIETQRELRIGSQSAGTANQGAAGQSGVEGAILATLNDTVPSAGLSYQQALRDLRDTERTSMRGTAAELREVLREVLDHFAPDSEVTKSHGFKPEEGRSKPTMGQKVRFVLRSRGLPSAALDSPQHAAELIEHSTASLARSIYNRGSVDTHILSTRREVQQLKLYVDSVLAELLQIHK